MRARFARHAATYERHGKLQRAIADRLARMLPELSQPNVLEIGCGTGFLTQHLLARYPSGRFLITDIAGEMVEACAARFANGGQAQFQLLDGEAPPETGKFDLIASSMVIHWFDDPLAGLKRLQARLAPAGELLYAVSGPEFLKEWSTVMHAQGFAVEAPRTGGLPGILEEQHQEVAYGSARQLLADLRGTGAARPLGDGRRLTPGGLKRAVRQFDAEHGGAATWHILYGRLGSVD